MTKKCKLCNIKLSEDGITQMDRWVKTHQVQQLDKEQEEAFLRAIFSKEAKRASKEEVMTGFKREGGKK